MSMLETLRKIIRQQTDKVETPVTNLYGAVKGQSPPILIGAGAQWLIAQIPGGSMLNLQQFLAAYIGGTRSTYEIIFSQNGIVETQSRIAGSPVVFLARGSVSLPADTLVRLGVNTKSKTSPFAVYVDGVLQKNSNGAKVLPLSIPAGQHLIEVIALSVYLELLVPPDIKVDYTLHILEAPIWKELATGNVNPQGQSTANLTWYNDVKAGGWTVNRRTPIYHSVILTVGGSTHISGDYHIEVTGDLQGSISVGDQLYVGDSVIGTVLMVSYDNPDTTIRIRMPFTTFVPSQGWIGANLATGGFIEAGRIQRIGQAAEITWSDTNVVKDLVYAYTIQAFDLFAFDQFSPVSEVKRIRVGDNVPPDLILFATGFPQVDQGRVRVVFLTPPDADYSGVRAIYRDVRDTGTASSGTATTLVDTAKNWGTTDFTGISVRITSGTGIGQVRDILSNTTTALTVSGWDVTPDGTSTYEIVDLINVFTDYGTPGQIDEFSFNLLREGIYYFPTFDTGGNIQGFFSANQWVYTADQYKSVPVTNVLVNNRTQKRQASQTILGMTLYSIPAAPAIFEDTFEEVDFAGFSELISATSDASGNSPVTLADVSPGFTADALINNRLVITQAGLNFGSIRLITANTTSLITFTPALRSTPNSSTYKVLEHAPNIVTDPTEFWTTSDSTSIEIRDNKAMFIVSPTTTHDMDIDIGVSTDYRCEMVIGRGGSDHGTVGSNLTYRSNAANTLRWQYGVLHVNSTTADIRYRYDSAGAGAWTTIATGYPWSEGNAKKLIVEIDGDQHTFSIADAFGHNEQILGRTIGTAGPLHTGIGWNVRGTSGDDWIDDIRVLSEADLVRVKYFVSPDDIGLEVLQFGWDTAVNTATSGSTTSLNDTTQLWGINELLGKRVRIEGGAASGDDRAIALNTIDQIVPSVPFSNAIAASDPYIVYDTTYSGTERLQFWKPKGNSVKFLSFHGEKLGVQNEPEKRVLLDADTIPELIVSAVKTADGEITISIIPDDDAKRWKLWMRIGQWPTDDGLSTGATDDRFLKLDETTLITSRVQSGLSDGTWDIMVTPFDSDGNAGPTATITLIITTTGGPPPEDPPESAAFSAINVTSFGAPAGDVKVYWNHTSNLNKVPDAAQDTGTAESGTSTTLSDTNHSQAWTTNKKAGRVVYLLSGAGSPAEVKIISNTADILTVASWPNGNPGSDTVYDIRLGWDLTIKVYDSINGPQNEATLTTGRDPWQDGNSGTDSPISKGHFFDGNIQLGTKGIDPYVTNTYTLLLYNFDGALKRTYTAIYNYYGNGILL